MIEHRFGQRVRERAPDLGPDGFCARRLPASRGPTRPLTWGGLQRAAQRATGCRRPQFVRRLAVVLGAVRGMIQAALQDQDDPHQGIAALLASGRPGANGAPRDVTPELLGGDSERLVNLQQAWDRSVNLRSELETVAASAARARRLRIAEPPEWAYNSHLGGGVRGHNRFIGRIWPRRPALPIRWAIGSFVAVATRSIAPGRPASLSATNVPRCEHRSPTRMPLDVARLSKVAGLRGAVGLSMCLAGGTTPPSRGNTSRPDRKIHIEWRRPNPCRRPSRSADPGLATGLGNFPAQLRSTPWKTECQTLLRACPASRRGSCSDATLAYVRRPQPGWCAARGDGDGGLCCSSPLSLALLFGLLLAAAPRRSGQCRR